MPAAVVHGVAAGTGHGAGASKVRLGRQRQPHHVVGLVGLPRSGTTLLASMLGAHSRINAIFEPWNRRSDPNHRHTSLGRGHTLDDFLRHFHIRMSRKQDVLLIKETTTELIYIDNL